MPGLSLIGAGNRMELKLGDRDAFERFSDDLLEGREVGVRVVGVVGVVGGRGSERLLVMAIVGVTLCRSFHG